MILPFRDVEPQIRLWQSVPNEVHEDLRLAQIDYGVVVAVDDPAEECQC